MAESVMRDFDVDGAFSGGSIMTSGFPATLGVRRKRLTVATFALVEGGGGGGSYLGLISGWWCLCWRPV